MKTINNKSELKNLVCTILDSAEKTRKKLQNMSTEDFLFNGKFGFLGTKWDTPAQDDDLGEQIQQSMTMLMTCYAIDWFYFNLVNFNNTSSEGYFTINDGDKNGVDLSFKGKSDLFTLTDPFTGVSLGLPSPLLSRTALPTLFPCWTTLWSDRWEPFP